MGSSPKGKGGGGGNISRPTVIPHMTSAPMTTAIKKNPVEEPMKTASMGGPLGFAPGKDGGPAIPKPYEYNVRGGGGFGGGGGGRGEVIRNRSGGINYHQTQRNQLAGAMRAQMSPIQRQTWNLRNRQR